MVLAELTDDCNLIFEMSLNGQKFEFPVNLLEKGNNFIITEPIKINGKVLSFSSKESVGINLICIRKDKVPVVWKAVGISVIMEKGKSQYKVTPSSEGFESNRRGAFRLFVGVTGVAQMGTNRKALDIIVRDVSENGFSFVTSEDVEHSKNMPVRLVFGDMQRNFSLMGIVVRKVVIDEKRIVYGCRLGVKNNNLAQYISEKQRQMMSMNKDNAAAKSKRMLEESMMEAPVSQGSSGDADYLGKLIKNDGTFGNRNLNTVGKTERRDIFKDKHSGKRV